MDIDLIQEILEKTHIITTQNLTKKQKNGECFSLLEILGLTEPNMCKIIAEIISPDGHHYQGTKFLKSFLKDVLKLEIDDSELAQASVYTEYFTNHGRKIDIVISTPRHFIPIEAKINAGDQKKQCSDYYNFAKETGKISSKVYYLTVDGHLPYETEGLTPIICDNEIIGYEEVTPISFRNDICEWLDKIKNSVADKPVLHMNLSQLENYIKNLGGYMDKELNNKIADLISTDSESIKTAVAIADSVNIAKEKLLPFGIPTDKKFTVKGDKDAARKKLGFTKDKVIFVMMGSMGYGNLDTIIDEIDGCDIDFEVAVACGNNAKARDMILAKNLKHKFHAYGFINNVDEFMDAADCIISKPGGLSVTESMAKNLPMILVDPIPGHEDRNVEFLVNNGVALYVWNLYGLGSAINLFYNNDVRRHELLTALSRVAKPGAVSDLGSFILASGKEKKQK